MKNTNSKTVTQRMAELMEEILNDITIITDSYIDSLPLATRTTMMYKTLGICDGYIKVQFTDYEPASKVEA